MTTTELIKILQDNETGAISLKPREISLIINGRYMPNPQITLSGTGDGICGAEIDLDVCGEWLEQEPCDDCCNGNQTEKAKLCQKSYIAGMEHKQEPLTDVLDKIRAEIEQYQADCDLSCSDDANCRTCNNITFGSIYRIIDKYKSEMLKQSKIWGCDYETFRHNIKRGTYHRGCGYRNHGDICHLHKGQGR